MTDKPANYTLVIRYQSVSTLQPNPHNARTHSKRQVRQIADSIRVFGFTNPILTDRNHQVVAGHGRLAAAKLLGINEVPTIMLEDLSEEQIRAYIIADNKLAENAGWDKDILAIELQHLVALDDLSFDVTVTGFEIPEIDILVGGSEEQEIETAELPQPGPAISQLGDVWLLGKHRLLCGDSLKGSSFRTLMGSRKAAAIFTDSPYNVAVDGHATGNGTVRHREFAMASGEMSAGEFSSFLHTVLGLLAAFSTPQSVHYLCMDWRHIDTLLNAGSSVYQEFLNICVWVKDNGGMGSFYRSQHELIAVFRNGAKTHRNNVQLGRFGRNRTNVWQYPGVQTMSKTSEEGNLLAMHPTVKPVRMVADAILDCTKRGDIVLDAFLGSGTTLLAAERVGRSCYGIELDPLYVDTAIRRWQNHTGSDAIHAPTGKTFSSLTGERLDEAA